MASGLVAVVFSTIEGYRWTWVAAVGVVLAVAGNLLALRGKPTTGERRKTGTQRAS